MRLSIGFLGMMGVFLVAYSCANGNGDGPGGGSNTNGVGGSPGNTCPNGSCNGVCVNLASDRSNCGMCDHACPAAQGCSNGVCGCQSPLSACGSSCVNLASDGNNCGTCGMVCAGGQVCSQGRCSSTCQSTELKCGASCVNASTDPTNCGQCDNRCTADQSCQNGTCTCSVAGQKRCGTQCVDVMSNVQNCGDCGRMCAPSQACVGGVCGGTPGTGGAGGGGGSAGTGGSTAGAGGAAGARDGGAAGTPDAGGVTRACPVTPGLIADFEEGAGKPVGVAQEGRNDIWGGVFNDGAAGATETMVVEASGGTADCDKWALHVSGGGFASFAGFGLDLNDAVPATNPPTPQIYNATQHNFTGIRFKAKIGPNQDSKAAIRFNLSTPVTEGSTNPGGNCTDVAATTEKAALPCFQHPGKFLSVLPADNDLTTTWKTFTYCFDRDLYPQSVPSNMTTAQRETVGNSILKVQFSFNAGNDYSLTTYPTNAAYPAIPKNARFDFWVDQIEFFTGACPTTANFQSAAGTAKTFPQNAALGTCAIATNAANYNTAISKAYATWKTRFVQGGNGTTPGDHIVAPEQMGGVTTSEAMGYGLMIAAAMGDRPQFDAFSGYVQSHLEGTGLMTWENGQSGSATDADSDIIYGYLMAAKQWTTGNYSTMANAMIAAFKAHDVGTGNPVPAGVIASGSTPLGATNPSYFSPYAYRLFGTFAADPIAAGYAFVGANVNAATRGMPTDWSDFSGAPALPAGAQVINQIAPGMIVYGYDAARVPWRLGMDKCLNGSTDMTVNTIVSTFATKYGNGAQIDLLKAGWIKSSGTAPSTAANMQGSFIGPMGVAGMAVGNTAMRDRAFRAMLDTLESPQFNHTYFPSTVGLITALIMSGNFPTP